MKLLKIWVLCSCMAMGVNAQGIKFINYTNWNQILAQAKTEHKNIFVNCYMEGGKPCIDMDEKVFPDKNVGRFYNDHYISVRVDMELVAMDEVSKALKAEADRLRKLYQVNGYPNLLYINPEGMLLHQALGYESPEKLIETGRDAFDPQKQLLTRIAAFRAGKVGSGDLSKLIIDAEMISHHQDAVDIANSYLNAKTQAQLLNVNDIQIIQQILKDEPRALMLSKKYVEGLTEDEKAQSENIHLILYGANDQASALKYAEIFVSKYPDSVLAKPQIVRLISRCAFLLGTDSKCFRVLFQNQDKIEKAANKPGYLNDLFDKLVVKEYIVPAFKTAQQSATDSINWTQLQTVLTSRFNNIIAERNLLAARVNWYRLQKNWPEFVKAVIADDKKFGNDRSDIEINTRVAMPILIRANNKTELQYGIARMGAIVNKPGSGASLMDTYANLLYKAGQTTSAINWEKKAISYRPEEKKFRENLDKMNNGMPTWSE